MNQWAEPAGFGPSMNDVPSVAYRILDRLSGKIVERLTSNQFDSIRGRYFLSLNFADQEYADEHTMIVQRACYYFYKKPEEYEPLTGWPESRTSDDEVRTRIARLNGGENAREAERMRAQKYPLDELPWREQRALIEEIDRLKAEWHFEIIGPATPGGQHAEPSPSPLDYGYDGA